MMNLGERPMIKKRHFSLTEKMRRDNPKGCNYAFPSLNIRQSIMDAKVPHLGHPRRTPCHRGLGRPSRLIFCCSSGAAMPGTNYELLNFLHLSPTVDRLMLYQVGCYGGGTVLRLAKDVAENISSARILAVCSEITVTGFRGPSETHVENLVGQAIFGDGAAAMVVRAPPFSTREKAVFELATAGQYLIPSTRGKIDVRIREEGLMFSLSPEIPDNIANCIEKILIKATNYALNSASQEERNSLLWVVHPGGRGIVEKVVESLGLQPETLRATREVMKEYENMWSPSVLFVMEVMRRRSAGGRG